MSLHGFAMELSASSCTSGADTVRSCSCVSAEAVPHPPSADKRKKVAQWDGTSTRHLFALGTLKHHFRLLLSAFQGASGPKHAWVAGSEEHAGCACGVRATCERWKQFPILPTRGAPVAVSDRGLWGCGTVGLSQQKACSPLFQGSVS